MVRRERSLVVTLAVSLLAAAASPLGRGGCSVALQPVGGRPAILFSDLGSQRFIRAYDNRGQTWGTPATLGTSDSYPYGALGVSSDGRPAAAFSHSALDFRGLSFAIANDTAGAIWSPPQSVVPQPYPVVGPSLTVMPDGVPALAFVEGFGTNFAAVTFVLGRDATGDSWYPPVIVANNSVASVLPVLALVDGNPAVAFGTPNAPLQFCRAGDTFGSSWPATAAVSIATSAATQPSMAVVNGRPAMTFYNPVTKSLWYVRAQDSTGSSWGTPVELDAQGDVGSPSSLSVINGNPAVAYSDATQRQLLYIRSTDSDGTTWGQRLVVDPTADSLFAPQTISLVFVEGSPAIAYFAASVGALRFAIATDSTGTVWSPPQSLGTCGVPTL